MFVKEEWKTIPKHSRYLISTLSNIKRKGKEKLLKKQFRDPYNGININGKRYRIAVLMAITFLGHIPNNYSYVIDHINNNPLDDRLINLQIITHRENCSKNRTDKTGFTGIHFNTKTKQYRVTARIQKKKRHLGCFNTIEKAIEHHKKAIDNVLLFKTPNQFRKLLRTL